MNGNRIDPKWTYTLVWTSWGIIGLHPLTGDDIIPYQPKLEGPMRLWVAAMINSSDRIRNIELTKTKTDNLWDRYDFLHV